MNPLGNKKRDRQIMNPILIDQNRGKATNGNFDRLKEIIEKGEISAEIQEGFPLEKLSSRENFISLLFYFGLLTIKEPGVTDLLMQIPNETARRLFYDYIKEAYEDTDVFSLEPL
jgi:hypothetical protein